MNAIDEYDVRECFAILDQDCQGSISVQDLQTMYLGLGFQEPVRMTCEELIARHYRFFDNNNQNINQQRLSLPVVLEILSHHSRNRQHNMQYSFQLLDYQNKGFLTVKDLQKAAADAVAASDGQDDDKETTIDNEQQQKYLAQQMVHYFGGKNTKNGDNNNDNNTSSSQRIYLQDFQQIFQPPDPY